MCNDYRLKTDIEAIRQDFDPLHVKIRFPEGIPNLQPRDDIRITDPAPIIRAAADQPGMADLVQRPWSWPGPSGKPVYCMRSEGRNFAEGRCLIPADGFYEFTANEDPKAKRKHKWLFTKSGAGLFCIAGIWRASPAGEAFTMLTVAPGADVAPYHARQVAIIERADWARWLDPNMPALDMLRPAPAGSLEVVQIA